MDVDMNINDVPALARALMDQHLPAGHRWTFALDSAKSRLGACQYTKRKITVSRHFAAHATEAEVRDTVLHEIAHVLTPSDKHGLRWKAVATRLGATPKACGTNPYLASEEVVAPKLAQVEGQEYVRVAHRSMPDRYRILRENAKTYTLIADDGLTRGASKALVYPDGGKRPTLGEVQAAMRQEALEEVKGKPIVRVTVPGYESKRYALTKPAKGRNRAQLVNLDTGRGLRVTAQQYRLETGAERLSGLLPSR